MELILKIVINALLVICLISVLQGHIDVGTYLMTVAIFFQLLKEKI